MFIYEFIARILLVLGGINYLTLVSFNTNILAYLKHPSLIKGVGLLIGISALYLMLNRDYYLPFLGKCVVPIKTNKNPEGKDLTTVTLDNLPPNVDVIYWASKSNLDHLSNPMQAYGNYLNSGISKSDANGSVTIQLECPSEYTISKFGLINKTLDKHVHYRYQLPESYGMLSRVYTKYINKC